MAHPITFEFKGVEFTLENGHLFIGDHPVSLLDFARFAAGQIDLAPPPPPEPGSIVDIVLETSGTEGLDDNGGDFDILREALVAAGLVETLADTEADFSVFAPTDDAFIELARSLGVEVADGDEAAALNGILAALTDLGGSEAAGLQLLTDVLLYHVAPDGRTLAELQEDGTISTALGASFDVSGTQLIDNEPDVTDPQVVAPDIAASNGTIQVIDRVLLPLDIPGNEPGNIVDIAVGSDDFNILVLALSTAGLVEAIQTSEDITVFAPTDAAFTQLALDLGFTGDQGDETAVFNFIAEVLATLGDPIELLTNILLYHVSPGEKTAAEIDALAHVDTLLEGATFGTKGTELIDNEPDVANPDIVIPDIPAANGAIQAIDRVLLPLDIPGNESDDVIQGTNGNDVLEGGGGDDRIFGFVGQDHISGGDGDDILSGGMMFDKIHGDNGDDRIHGGKGNDALFGGHDDDIVRGSNGDDLVKGGAGNDKLFGGKGDDRLLAGAGDDKLSGGQGSDLFDFEWVVGENRVHDFSTEDTIELSAFDFADFDAVLANATQVGHATEITGDRGSILLLSTDVEELQEDSFTFV
ncbi:MAG: fasciclin domain-containing protein [Pseudomonadota bacterium]